MAIIGKAIPRSKDIIIKVADLVGCEPAVIDAIVQKETYASGFDPAKRLVIRPEAHKVATCPYLSTPDRKRAAKLGFTSQPKLLAYERDAVAAGSKAWAWVDALALQFGQEAAFYVTSFGSPQIMGFNFRQCGYDSPSLMVRAFADSEDAQLIAMGKFLIASNGKEACRLRKWSQIARLYNGKNYAKNHYDTDLEQLYNESAYAKSGGIAPIDDDILQYGSHGALVVALQGRLSELGFHVDPDGDFGAETRDAVRAFQFRQGLVVDGKVGASTQSALLIAAPKEPNSKPVTVIARESGTAQAGAATVAVGAASLATATASAVTDSDSPTSVPLHILHQILAIGVDKLLIALGVGAIIFGGYAIWRRIRAQRLRKIG